MITCRRAAGIGFRRIATALACFGVVQAMPGLFDRFLQRLDQEFIGWVPLGYEDERGFHFGPKPEALDFRNN